MMRFAAQPGTASLLPGLLGLGGCVTQPRLPPPPDLLSSACFG